MAYVKKKKVYNLWGKLRSATRAVWMYSPHHREALSKVLVKDPKNGNYFFDCPLCGTNWHKAMAAVDHNPAVGSFDSWDTYADWCKRLFEGPVRVIDKICHKNITNAQRKKNK